MMVNEARRLLARDGRRLVHRAESGKLGPEQLGPVVLQTIATRIGKAAPDRITSVLCERAVHASVSARTHSELFGFKLSALLTTALPRLGPEEQRGILFYVTGDEKQHGLAVLCLEVLGESSGVDVTTRLVEWRSERMTALRNADKRTRISVKGLPPQIRRLCVGAFRQAALVLENGDDRTVAAWTRQVRRLVKRFGKGSK